MSLLHFDANISILSLPLYYALSTLPHAYAIYTASGGNVAKWDNRNPRAAGLKDSLKNRIGDEVYARYERAEAAHYNSLESIPILYAAVTLGNIAKLSVTELNNFVIGAFILRILYQAMYIRNSTQSLAGLCTLIWYIQTGWSLRLLWRAGIALA